MYAAPTSAVNYRPSSLSAAGKPLFAPPSTVRVSIGSSRRMEVTAASVSTFAEPIRVNSGGRTLSLYEILRVKNTASLTEIKTAYRSLAKLYHPDANHEDDVSDGHDFIEIHNAYETLSDPAARALYDLSLSAAMARSRPIGFPGGFYRTRRWETDQCW